MLDSEVLGYTDQQKKEKEKKKRKRGWVISNLSHWSFEKDVIFCPLKSKYKIEHYREKNTKF